MSAPVELHRPGPGARMAARLGGRIPVLDTPRLQMRGPRIYDFDAFAAIYTSDRAVHLGGPFTRSQAWAAFTGYTALWLLHGHGLWTIDAQTQPSAGFVTLAHAYDDPEPELGVFLTEEAQGHGFAREALQAARDHAFKVLHWDRVISCVTPGNARCIALMRALGAERDGRAEGALGDAVQVFRHLPSEAAT